MEVRNSLLRRKRTLEKIFHLKIFHFNRLQELEEQVQQLLTVLCYRKQERLGKTHVGNYNVYFYAFSSNSQHDFNTHNIKIPGASWYYNSDENWVPAARSSLSCALRPAHLGFISLRNQMYYLLSVQFLCHPHPWTWKDELYKVRDYLTLTSWTNHCSWPMRNSHLLLRKCHFLLQALLEGPGNMYIFPSPKQFQNVFLQIFIQKVYSSILLLQLGMPSQHISKQEIEETQSSRAGESKQTKAKLRSNLNIW